MKMLATCRAGSLFFLCACSFAVTAQDESPAIGQIGGSINLGTDYVFRGISNSNERPQVQADLNWSHSDGLYAGVWASNTDFGGPGNSMEVDPYIGHSAAIGASDWSYDVGFWYYHYPGAQSDFDYWETYGILTYTLDMLSITGSLWYADNYFGDDFFGDESSLAYHVIVSYELPMGATASGRIGEQTYDEPAGLSDQDYTYYDIGASKNHWGLTFSLRWHDTDGVQPTLADPDLADGRLVARITKSF